MSSRRRCAVPSSPPLLHYHRHRRRHAPALPVASSWLEVKDGGQATGPCSSLRRRRREMLSGVGMPREWEGMGVLVSSSHGGKGWGREAGAVCAWQRREKYHFSSLQPFQCRQVSEENFCPLLLSLEMHGAMWLPWEEVVGFCKPAPVPVPAMPPPRLLSPKAVTAWLTARSAAWRENGAGSRPS